MDLLLLNLFHVRKQKALLLKPHIWVHLRLWPLILSETEILSQECPSLLFRVYQKGKVGPRRIKTGEFPPQTLRRTSLLGPMTSFPQSLFYVNWRRLWNYAPSNCSLIHSQLSFLMPQIVSVITIFYQLAYSFSCITIMVAGPYFDCFIAFYHCFRKLTRK